MISIIDAVLLICLSGFVFYGFFFGLVRTFGSLVGVVVAVILASRFYLPVAAWLDGFFFGYDNAGKVAIFIIIFSLVQRVVSFGFGLLDTAVDIFSIIPFLKSINRLTGAILGLVLGILVIGLMLYVANKYAVIDYWTGKWLIDSRLAPQFLRSVDLIAPFLPDF